MNCCRVAKKDMGRQDPLSKSWVLGFLDGYVCTGFDLSEEWINLGKPCQGEYDRPLRCMLNTNVQEIVPGYRTLENRGTSWNPILSCKNHQL